ncbi:MAG: DegT/DnrJ/EryC1/StrS family aminotransferase [Anaerolineales bacterium]|nr:DegT/DnrJ/EryC1/StrS family aminotransferase [Anaerolineales bacterium]
MTRTNPIFRVPLSSPDITDVERQAVMEVLNTPNLSMGPHYQAFEKAIADYVGVKHAIAVSSGTSGLHLCIRAAGIQPGDLVLTTPFSFMASTNAILYEKAVPVFVDAEAVTGNIDPQQLIQAADDLMSGGKAAERWLPKKGAERHGDLKAILPVDVFGQPAEMDAVAEIAKKYHLTVIEDSCEALGAGYKGKQAGTLGDMGVFAFYPNKQITTAEGGMIVTDDDGAAEMMRALRNQGRAPGDTWLQHSYLGYNYRMDELSAVLGAVQMSRLDELLAKRAQVAAWYNQRLGDLPMVEIPEVVATTTRMSWFVYVIRVSPQIDRDGFIHRLAEAGIPARPYFAPIHLQLYMMEMFGYQPGEYPVTEDLGNRGIALPFSSVLTEDQVELVCEVLGDLLTD